MATIKFDQVGLTPPGVAGKTRSDGLANGAQVTITTSDAGTVQFLWVPYEDISAVASLTQTSPTTWTFVPTTSVYGTYRVKFTPTATPAATTIRLFIIRTPLRGLRIPALNERASPNASLINHGADMLAASEFNEDDTAWDGEGPSPFETGNYAGWWSALSELFMAVENMVAAGGTVEQVFTDGIGLDITDEFGPNVNIELNFGTTTGTVADGGVVAAISSTVAGHTSSISSISSTVGTHTTQISANTANIATNTSNLTAHIANVSNPHSTTKAQVGLTNVTDDAQLKRANNDWAGYSAITSPTLSDKLLSEIAAGGVKGTLQLSALVTLIKSQLRDPIWDAPTISTADSDEFDVDTVASGAWTATLSNGQSMIRDGAVDPTQACATRHYRSSVVGGVLVLQIRQNESVFFHKTVAAALSSNQLWTIGIGLPTEPGTGSANDPGVAFGLYRNNAGFLDFSNQALVRTGSSAERIESLSVVAGGPSTNATNGFNLVPMDGLALRIDHGSAAAGNMCGFGFRRGGALTGFLSNQSVQYNLSTDRVAFNLMSNSAGTLTGANNALFTVHFVRRVAVTNPGFLAQA